VWGLPDTGDDVYEQDEDD